MKILISGGSGFIGRNLLNYLNENDMDIMLIGRNLDLLGKNNYKKKLLNLNDPDYNFQDIKNFNPDIIHVFGTESNFGLLNKYTSIPIVIHLQGILNPYLNAYFPPNKSIFNYIFNYSVLKSYFHLKLKTPREIKIIKNNKFFIGRTAWDYSVVKLINNKIKYFHCD